MIKLHRYNPDTKLATTKIVEADYKEFLKPEFFDDAILFSEIFYGPYKGRWSKNETWQACHRLRGDKGWRKFYWEGYVSYYRPRMNNYSFKTLVEKEALIEFNYEDLKGARSTRKVILYGGYGDYVYGHCRLRVEQRTFYVPSIELIGYEHSI